MKINLKFAKLAQQWYVVLPDYSGKVENLEMVAGADVFLDTVANGHSIVVCMVSDEQFIDAEYHLTQINPQSGDYAYGNQRLWLCSVNKYVWGGAHPDHIYVKIDQTI